MRAAIFALAAALAASCGAEAEPRIASLDQCADQYVLALAPRDEIVSVSKRALNDDSFERALAVGLPQQRATLEALLAERATIAVRYWTPDVRLPAALQRRGVTVVQIDEASDFTGIRANVRKVAAAFGRPAEGAAAIARMDAELAQSRNAWGGAKALYLTPESFTAGPATLVGAMMAAAGLTTVARGGYAPVSLEALVLHPPTALVLAFFSDLEGGRQHWTIAANGYLQGLARERTIASLPGRVLGCPAWPAADGALMLAKARAAPH